MPVASRAGGVFPAGWCVLKDVTINGVRLGRALADARFAGDGELPVLEIVSSVHIIGDLTLGLGRVAGPIAIVDNFRQSHMPASNCAKRNLTLPPAIEIAVTSEDLL
jgi:hypothetical protein